MTDFDPAEFDTPAPSAPAGEDYRLLLAAMRQAGAQGVQQEMGELRAALASMAQTTNDLDRIGKNLRADAADLKQATVKHYVVMFGALIAVVFAVGVIIRWMQEPKIEQRLYGCTAQWDAKTKTCKGKWVPLVSNSDS